MGENNKEQAPNEKSQVGGETNTGKSEGKEVGMGNPMILKHSKNDQSTTIDSISSNNNCGNRR